jgi:hypothetical protein
MHSPVPIYVVSLSKPAETFVGTIIQSKPGAKSMSVNQKYVHKQGLPKFRLDANGRTYVVESFESFVQTTFPKPGEASND